MNCILFPKKRDCRKDSPFLGDQRNRLAIFDRFLKLSILFVLRTFGLGNLFLFEFNNVFCDEHVYYDRADNK